MEQVHGKCERQWDPVHGRVWKSQTTKFTSFSEDGKEVKVG